MTSISAQLRAWERTDLRSGLQRRESGHTRVPVSPCPRAISSHDGCARGVTVGTRAGGCSEHPSVLLLLLLRHQLLGAHRSRAQPFPAGALAPTSISSLRSNQTPSACTLPTFPGSFPLLVPPPAPQPSASPCPGAALPYTAPGDKGPAGPGCHKVQKTPPKSSMMLPSSAAESPASPRSPQT